MWSRRPSTLDFARKNGVEIRRGDPKENVPGKAIVIPERFDQLQVSEMDLGRMRKSYVRNAVNRNALKEAGAKEIKFLAEDSSQSEADVAKMLGELGVKVR